MLTAIFRSSEGLLAFLLSFFLNCDAPAPLVASPVALFVAYLGCVPL